MKRLLTVLVVLLVGASTATAQRYYDDRHFYDEDFDWHWDVRVRISDGINSGYLTNWEANRLYRKLEKIEDKEYRYMADGRYTDWEQNDIWEDVIWLNRRVGIELDDYDRRFYGFNGIYIGFNSYPFWYNRYYRNGWDFYRFDRLGWGSYRYGYVPRYYVPHHNVYVNNHIYKNYNNNVKKGYNNYPRYDNRNNSNVIRRDRTDPANRVGANTRSRSTTTYPNTRSRTEATKPNSRTYSGSREAAKSGSYTPRENRSYGNSSATRSSGSNGSLRKSSSSSSSRSSAVKPSSRSSRSSSTVRSSSPSRSSSARSSSSRSSSSSSSRSSSSRSSRN